MAPTLPPSEVQPFAMDFSFDVAEIDLVQKVEAVAQQSTYGRFRQARSMFKEKIEEHNNMFLVYAEYLRLLYDQGDFKALSSEHRWLISDVKTNLALVNNGDHELIRILGLGPRGSRITAGFGPREYSRIHHGNQVRFDAKHTETWTVFEILLVAVCCGYGKLNTGDCSDGATSSIFQQAQRLQRELCQTDWHVYDEEQV